MGLDSSTDTEPEMGGGGGGGGDRRTTDRGGRLFDGESIGYPVWAVKIESCILSNCDNKLTSV